MGIERFFTSLSRDFNVVTDLKKPYRKINCTHFMIDFNSIIHNVSSKMISSNDFETIGSFEIELINNIKKNVIDMLENNIESNQLKYMMIAIDGVPSFAKMMEQKKRRYIGDLFKTLMKDVELPIEWSKNNISPGTEFMDTLCKELNKREFMDDCKKVCKNLDGVLVSDIYNPGEGEMKILNCLRGLNITTNRVCVYSPDSDMILLLLLLKIPTELLRYDQQKSKEEKEDIYNHIDVNEFKKQLLEYCSKRLNNIRDPQLIINEIVYIFTIFGDDFLPKIESIQVGSDINYLLDNYLLTLKDRGNILMKKKDMESKDVTSENLYDLNVESIKYLFDQLSKNELLDLNRNFYQSKYKNYIYATINNLNVDINLFKKYVSNIIVKFIARHNSLNRTKNICTPLNVATCIDVSHFQEFFLSKYDSKFDYNKKINENKKENYNRDFYSELIKKLKKQTKSNEEFHLFIYNISKIIDGMKLYQTLYGDNVLASSLKSKKNNQFIKLVERYKSLYYLKLKPNELINELILFFYMQPMDLPFIDSFNKEKTHGYQKFQKREFDSSKHVRKIIKLGFHEQEKKKEKLEYIINNKLDDYYYLFNPIHPFYESKIKSTEKYYLMMFPKKDKKSIVNKYIEGFYWVLNYYINNRVNNMWFYPFARTPLLSDLKNGLFEDNLEYDNIVHFNPLESIIFITPLESTNILEFLPSKISEKTKKEIISFINKNQYFFLPLAEIKTRLMQDIKSLPDLLDCSVSIFLSKCHYKLLEENNNPELYIKKFREIIPLENQEIKNNETFRCVELNI